MSKKRTVASTSKRTWLGGVHGFTAPSSRSIQVPWGTAKADHVPTLFARAWCTPAERALAHRLADPEASPALITMLPDPQAVAFLKAQAPGIAAMHRRLTHLEALHRAGRLTRSRTQQ
jgi:hypothetical protein